MIGPSPEVTHMRAEVKQWMDHAVAAAAGKGEVKDVNDALRDITLALSGIVRAIDEMEKAEKRLR